MRFLAWCQVVDGRIEWRCLTCGEVIADDEGYVWLRSRRPQQYPRPWISQHRRCDTERDSLYWIGVEDLRTLENLLTKTAHLATTKTRWICDTDWFDLMREIATYHGVGLR